MERSRSRKAATQQQQQKVALLAAVVAAAAAAAAVSCCYLVIVSQLRAVIVAVVLWPLCRLLVHTEFRDILGLAKSIASFKQVISDIEEKCRVCITDVLY